MKIFNWEIINLKEKKEDEFCLSKYFQKKYEDLLDRNWELYNENEELKKENLYLKNHQKIEIVQYYEGNKKVIRELLEED